MTTGKQLEKELVAVGINALWIKGRGMIIMSAYYGTDCAVQGTYDVYSLEVSKRLLSAMKDKTCDLIAGEWLQGEPTRGTYKVR